MKTALLTLAVVAMATAALAAPKAAPAKGPVVPKVTPAMLAQGKQLFTTTCVACHGEKGDGTGPAAAALTPKPRNFVTENFKNGDKPEQIFKTIGEGITGTGMASFSYMPEGDRWALAHYVTTLRPAKK